jgi:hypothetical protein
LDAATATRGAEALGALIRQSDSTQALWPGLSTALAAVCRQLPASDAAFHVNGTVDFILKARDTTEEKDKFNYYLQAQALGALCGRLDAARASRTIGAIIAILGDGPTIGGIKSEFIIYRDIASVLTKVAERLDAPGAGGRPRTWFGSNPVAADAVVFRAGRSWRSSWDSVHRG